MTGCSRNLKVVENEAVLLAVLIGRHMNLLDIRYVT